MAYAVITGASKGIGKCLAEELAQLGYDLLLIARTESLLATIASDLQEKYKIKTHFLALDLSLDDSTIKIREWVIRNKIQVSILVNNAGYGLWGAFEKLTLEQHQALLKVNISTTVNLCYEMLPLLRQNTPSYILNVASSAAYQAVPTLSVYAAAKSFIVLFTRGLRYELRDSGVSVSCLSPGPTDTNFMNTAGMTTPEMIKRASKFNMKPEDVARIAIKKMLKGKSEIIPGFLNRISIALTYFAPKSLTEKVAAGLYE